jgi:hypothetical protein
MIERLGIADDQQHLDIAAGTGEPGLTVAKLAPRGHVVLTDLVALGDETPRGTAGQAASWRAAAGAAVSLWSWSARVSVITGRQSAHSGFPPGP